MASVRTYKQLQHNRGREKIDMAVLVPSCHMKTTAPLVEKIVLQVHETPDDVVVYSIQ